MRILSLIPFFLILGIIGCDKAEPFDTPPNQNGNGGGGTDTTGTDTTGTQNVQKVLVEDLTGFRCTNCPQAHNIADNLQSIYGSQLVVVGVHCSLQFAYPTGATPDDPYHTDFRTTAGDAYYEVFGNPGLPKGLINRRVVDGSAVLSPQAWAETVSNILEETPKAGISINGLNYNESTRQVSFDVAMSVEEDLEPGQYFTTIYLTEDSIYDWQLDNGTDVENYLHRHVLRDNINGTWGDLAFSNGSAGQENTLSYTYTIDDNWKEEHCEIVAYIYNADTREIVQVDKKLVMNP